MVINTCVLCGTQARLGAIKFTEGMLCRRCGRRLGYNSRSARSKTLEDVKADLKAVESREAKERAFEPTKVVGGHLAIDEAKQQWQVRAGKKPLSPVRDYADIISFELLEDGETLAKGGLGRALVGGALFGGIGAIVGGVTAKKSKNVVNSMQIKITIRDMSRPTEMINLISSRTKHNSLMHRLAREQAQEILSTLELMKEIAEQKE